MRTTFTLSVGEPGASTTAYTTTEINTSDLQKFITSKNYSPILWNGPRSQESFSGATGFAPDIDDGLTFDEAKKRIEAKQLHAILVTTRNHQKEKHGITCDRFRVIIPFNRKVYTQEDYQRIIRNITGRDGLFPECDNAVLETGRQYFPSPGDAVFMEYFSKFGFHDFNVDEGLKSVPDAFDATLRVKTSGGKEIRVWDSQVRKGEEKTGRADSCWCPYCRDEDDLATSGTASAVIYVKLFQRSIYCSHCGVTYLSKMCYPSNEDITKGFYAHGASVAKVGLYLEEETRSCGIGISTLGWKNAFLLMGIQERSKKDELQKYLSSCKLIPDKVGQRVMSDMEIATPEYSLVNDKWIIRVPAIKSELDDDAFVDEWLNSLFGDHANFIREWLAIYTYTNYKVLPHILLYGEKGSGKSLFSDVVSSIFPYLSRTWTAEESQFTEWADAKLLVADETMSRRDISQYAQLKRLAGQAFLKKNEKFEKSFDTRNNTHIIILSNDPLPIFVEKQELPTEASNNPLFVLEMNHIPETERDKDLKEKLVKRLGHYLRVRLKGVFDNLDKSEKYRFHISCPITEEEKKLYALNQTSIESVAMRFMDRIEDGLEDESNPARPYLLRGFIPSELLSEFESKPHSLDEVLRWMAKRKKITSLEKDRPRLYGNHKNELPRKRCYTMTEAFRKELDQILLTWSKSKNIQNASSTLAPASADLFGPVDHVDRGSTPDHES